MKVFEYPSLQRMETMTRFFSISGVYILEVAPGVVKVGSSRKMKKRLQSYKWKKEFTLGRIAFLYAFKWSPHYSEREILKELCRKFPVDKREWFKTSFDEILAEIKALPEFFRFVDYGHFGTREESTIRQKIKDWREMQEKK